MKLAGRILPTVAAQITAIMVVALVLAHLVTFLVIVTFGNISGLTSDPMAAAGQVGMLVRLYDAAPDADGRAALVARASGETLKVEAVPVASVVRGVEPGNGVGHLFEIIMGQPGRVLSERPTEGGTDVVVSGRGGEALLFHVDRQPILSRVRLIPFFLSVVLAFLGIVLVGAYAVRWITAPLSRVASTANAYGRGGAEIPLPEQDLPESGPREIVQVARALNGMRRRVGTILDERTRMLAAIGHDLRTPLTRLRLRIEQVREPAMRDGMAREVTRIDAMLREILTYLGGERDAGTPERVDAGSLAATVCDEFADVGHDVAYEGGGRVAVTCRPAALVRILENLVENAVRHGGRARVRVVREGGRVAIEVADDGPGIPESQRDAAFEPFRTGDGSRTKQGFGLGLGIARSLARGMDGDVELAGAAGGGLLARVLLPAASAKAA